MLETARSQLDVARSTLEQLKTSQQRRNASQLSIDQQNLTLLNANNQFLDAQKNYRGAFAITPLSHRVSAIRFIEQYQELMQILQHLLSRLNSLRLNLLLLNRICYHVEPGSEVILTIPMVQNKSWYGKIMVWPRAADQQNGLFSAEAYFDNKNNELKAGTSERIQLALTTFDNSIVIPTEAIVMEEFNTL